MSHNPIVLTYKSALMQRLADYVRLGYKFWTAGEVSLARASALARKFSRYYRVDLDRNRRARARRANDGCAVLLLWMSQPDRISWHLLVTVGDHPAHKLERLQDATTDAGRITLTGYELVRLTRKGAAKPSWTWRMSEETYGAWRSRVIELVRHRKVNEAGATLASLYGTPGFAGARRQVGKILALFKAEWRRAALPQERFPSPLRLRYLQRLRNNGKRLSHLLAERINTQK